MNKQSSEQHAAVKESFQTNLNELSMPIDIWCELSVCLLERFCFVKCLRCLDSLAFVVWFIDLFVCYLTCERYLLIYALCSMPDEGCRRLRAYATVALEDPKTH